MTGNDIGVPIALHSTLYAKPSAHKALRRFLEGVLRDPDGALVDPIPDREAPWGTDTTAIAIVHDGLTMLIPSSDDWPCAGPWETQCLNPPSRIAEAILRSTMVEEDDQGSRFDHEELDTACTATAQVVVDADLDDDCIREWIERSDPDLELQLDLGVDAHGRPFVQLDVHGDYRTVEVQPATRSAMRRAFQAHLHVGIVDPDRELTAGSHPAPSLLVSQMLSDDDTVMVELPNMDPLSILRRMAAQGGTASS
jgi:hypothetical protein